MEHRKRICDHLDIYFYGAQKKCRKPGERLDSDESCWMFSASHFHFFFSSICVNSNFIWVYYMGNKNHYLYIVYHGLQYGSHTQKY